MSVTTVPYTLLVAGMEKSLAGWGVRADASWSIRNKEKDVLALWTVEPFDPVAPQWSWGAAVVMYRNRSLSGGGAYSGGTIIFQGQVGDAITRVEGPRQGLGYKVYGAWWQLTRLTFKQTRNIFTGWTGGTGAVTTPPVLAAVFLAETYLGEDPSAVMWTGNQAITEILNWANETYNPTKRGATSGRDNTQDLIQIGTIDCGQPFPKKYANNVSCADAILQILEYFLATVGWLDYTTTPPTLNFRDISNLTGVSVTISANQEQEIELAPDYERQIDGVLIVYKQITETDGVPWPSLYRDAYPTTITDYTPYVLTHVVDIPGWKMNNMRGTVAVTSLADALSSTAATRAAFWGGLDPNLQDPLIDPASIQCDVPSSITDDSGNPVNTTNFPSILNVGCSVSSWMAGVSWVEATIKVPVRFTRYQDTAHTVPANGLETVSHTMNYKVVLTNANTGTYTGAQLSDTGEAVPPCYPTAGSLAYAAYNSGNTLQYKGKIKFLGQQVKTGISVGNLLTLVGPNNTYTNLVVQGVEVTAHTGDLLVEFGPVPRMSPGKLVEMWRASRWRTTLNMPSGRASGQGTFTASIDQTGAAAKENTTHTIPQFGLTGVIHDQGTVGGTANGVTAIQHDATNEQIVLQRVKPTGLSGAGQNLGVDGHGIPIGSITLALPAAGGKAVALQTLPGGPKVLATPDFALTAPFMFLGFALPSGFTIASGQQALNMSPNGSMQVMLLCTPWTPGMSVPSGPPWTGVTLVLVAMPEHLRSTISSKLVPDLTGGGTSGTVTYSTYYFKGQSLGGAGAYYDQYRTATPPGGSGLPVETQYITEPYCVGDVLWAITANTGVNVQMNSGDAILSASVVAGGTGYAVGDTFVLASGSISGTSPVFIVTSISGGGSTGPVTGITYNGGALTAVTYTSGACPTTATSGSGTGCTVTVQFWGQLLDYNKAARAWGN